MKVAVKCFATLSEADHCHFEEANTYDIEDGANVKTLIEHLDLPAEQVAIVFVNQKRVPPETPLSEGDQVGLFPAVGGM